MDEKPNTDAVIYDGECPLCRKSVAWLRRLDWRKRLSYINFRDESDPFVASIPTTQERMIAEMHVWPASRTRLHHGFGAFRFIAWRLPLMWPIVPLLYLPGVPWLGQKVYLWVARNRYHLVPCHDGVCTIQQNKPRPPTRP